MFVRGGFAIAAPNKTEVRWAIPCETGVCVVS